MLQESIGGGGAVTISVNGKVQASGRLFVDTSSFEIHSQTGVTKADNYGTRQ